MASQRGEVFDAAEQIDLFSGVVVSEDDQGVRFSTPERLLKSKKYGSFALKVFGNLQHFKEHDDYGNVRFLQQNGEISAAIWAPHLYAFESVDSDTNLPTILDRERCSFAVTLNRTEDGPVPVPRPREIVIHSSRGIFAAVPDMGLSFPGEDLYTEFEWFEHDAVAQHVVWPVEEAPSVIDFMSEQLIIDPQGFERILHGEDDLPNVFERSHIPLDFRTRKSWANESAMQAFGDIWVPVDDLRRGIDAQIEFLMFQQ